MASLIPASACSLDARVIMTSGLLGSIAAWYFAMGVLK
jgi:hypothetical protein